MNRIILIVLLGFVSNLSVLLAQNDLTCGTLLGENQKTFESKYPMPQGTATQALPQVNRVVHVSVYVVSGAVSFNTSSLVPVIEDSLNQYFGRISLRFKICNTTLVTNHQFDSLNVMINGPELIKQYSERNTINLYLVTNLIAANGKNASGLTYMPVDSNMNYIFIEKKSFSSLAMAHQLGHFFDLYHTHETGFGTELPDKSNCSTTGDRCCDTEASPDLSLAKVDSVNCTYKDMIKVQNQLYSPSLTNIMSSGPAKCRCCFSNTQYLRMVYALNNFRKYLR
jgi:Pregnancy-associated plasma protein-A.